MTELSASAAPSEFNVTLLKRQQRQEESVTTQLIQSAQQTAPNHAAHPNESGKVVNVKA